MLDTLCINTLRTLSIDAIERANSGHPGLPLGAAPMAYVLWDRHLKVWGKEPTWPDRDRFVLSAGHGSMLLYSLLHVYGFDLSLDELKNFRQWGSRTAGHPEFAVAPGVDATTGPLGQGCSNAVGMAIAERALAQRYNRPGHTIVDHYTYALLGDGDVMEGVSAEAASLAGHLKLGKLIQLYDANDVCLDGPTGMTFTEDVAKRYEAYGWHVQTVPDGDTDLAAIDAAITAAKQDERPSLIIVKTTIGYGSPAKAGTSAAHGSPLGRDEVEKTKQALGWPTDRHFHIPDDAAAHFHATRDERGRAYAAWASRFAEWGKAFPDLAEEWRLAQAGELPAGWDDGMPEFAANTAIATRSAGGKVLNALAKNLPWLLGGDADLSCSTKTAIAGGTFDGQSGDGRNIHYGVREHAMGAIANGIAYHGGLRTYTATFFCFADYMRPALRLAALNHLPTIHVFTHDSIGLGEDGPTHQAVEHLASLRCMPNMDVVRPADAYETVEAWRYALLRTQGPTSLVLSRQDLPVLPQSTTLAKGLHRGAYVLKEAQGDAALLLVASGSEVALAIAAAEKLEAEDIPTRVVSMPCWEAFDRQDEAYRRSVIPDPHLPTVVIEAGVHTGWHKYVGHRAKTITVERYGVSAPAEKLFAEFGFHTEQVVATAHEALAQ